MTTHHTSRTTHRRNERPLCITCTLGGGKELSNTVRYRCLFCRIPNLGVGSRAEGVAPPHEDAHFEGNQGVLSIHQKHATLTATFYGLSLVNRYTVVYWLSMQASIWLTMWGWQVHLSAALVRSNPSSRDQPPKGWLTSCANTIGRQDYYLVLVTKRPPITE